LRVAPYDRVVDPEIVVPRPWSGIRPRNESGSSEGLMQRDGRAVHLPPSVCHPIPPAVFVSPERHQS
ncbi:hypothetical protein, partial [Sphaerobacter thermophilus]|uniref:hypothetical protein n=1 Tax=Sphaerobacter thermophilus TaxID=2057 RepID=UPI0039C4BDBB